MDQSAIVRLNKSAADKEVTATSGAIEKKVGGQVKRWSISRSIDQHERRRQCW